MQFPLLLLLLSCYDTYSFSSSSGDNDDMKLIQDLQNSVCAINNQLQEIDTLVARQKEWPLLPGESEFRDQIVRAMLHTEEMREDIAKMA